MPFRVGANGECRAVVCVGGAGEIEWGGKRYPLATGDTVLLPAEVGECVCSPGARDRPVLECGYCQRRFGGQMDATATRIIDDFDRLVALGPSGVAKRPIPERIVFYVVRLLRCETYLNGFASV